MKVNKEIDFFPDVAVRSPKLVSSECHRLVDIAALTKITDLVFLGWREWVLG